MCKMPAIPRKQIIHFMINGKGQMNGVRFRLIRDSKQFPINYRNLHDFLRYLEYRQIPDKFQTSTCDLMITGSTFIYHRLGDI